jgi:hypothetical protein
MTYIIMRERNEITGNGRNRKNNEENEITLLI